MTYQTMPPLSFDEFSALKEDIKARGVQVPIEYDEDGNVLDGHHRIRAVEELKAEGVPVPSPPRIIRPGLSEPEKRAHARALNLARRHLDQAQKRAAIAAQIKDTPERSDRQIAAGLGVSHPTVAVARKELEDAGELERFTSCLGADGKTRPRAKPKHKPVHLSTEAVEKAEALSEKQREAILSGKTSAARAKKQADAEQKEIALQQAQKEISESRIQSLDAVCDIRVCSCRELFQSGIKPDAVITDPPYPHEFLACFSELAESCKLASVPLIAVMSGQSYLPEVMQRMCEHLEYRWTIAYLTPGGQAAQQWPRKVNAFWKPILLFGNASDWIGDVAKSDVNDNDKRHHNWGQSESGMADLIGRLTKPGQIVCDPFLGGGTTAVVSLALGRRFIGCDIDPQCVENTRKRLS